MSDILLKNPVCAICGTKNVFKKNKHVFYLINCKECEHAYTLIEEKNIKKFTKETTLENCFCPYLTVIKQLSNKQFQVKLSYGDFNNSFCHYFSEKSIKKFLLNLGVNFNIQIDDNIATFTILRH